MYVIFFKNYGFPTNIFLDIKLFINNYIYEIFIENLFNN